MKRSVLDILYGLGALGIAGFFFWETIGAVPPETSVADDPYWYPRLLLILMAVLALAMIARAVFAATDEIVIGPRWPALLAVVIIVGGYAALFTWTGFAISTLIFFPIFAYGLGYRRIVPLAIASPLVVAVTWYAFHYGLGMTPPGIGLPLLP
ncbi:hypothetical protein STA1M1_07010 [Sinisalibacter aestuarii]|uniref:DUF1468 domain-containing protein n=1 Tax=Sinisalibacter aestuarii TaxID=2949426 RepID=A0ABQ5LPA3_9RHOB|nr:hypothetical protein STA1M1_07010 [Sinisalibacter aestuarii]